MPHDLKPQQEVEKTLPFSLKDLEEPIIGEPLNENVAFAQSVYLNDCYQVFKEVYQSFLPILTGEIYLLSIFISVQKQTTKSIFATQLFFRQ